MMGLLRLLHVDDETDIRQVAAMSLELDPEIGLTSVESGQAALNALCDGLRPDVILLDVMMPQMDGPSVLKQLRRYPGLETTPVIFMTARVRSSEQDHYLAAGAIGVIIKPFDPMTLARQVRDLLSGMAA